VMVLRIVCIAVLCGCCSGVGAVEPTRLVWPTPNAPFSEGRPLDDWVQPTAAGNVESALFGCVRNDGNRFHEGIDIKATQRDRRGEATDPIYAAMDGVVAYINTTAWASGYGRYVVLEHPHLEPGIHTLYAHLRSVAPGLSVGRKVDAGEIIGTMGRSAGGYTIPRSRAHLHFEIGVRLTDAFQQWFDRQPFESPNRHGLYNGMNLVGLDPVAFFRRFFQAGPVDPAQFFTDQPVAFTLMVSSRGEPDFVRRYPSLRTRELPSEAVAGWLVGFTWYGLPVRWTPLGEEAHDALGAPGSVAVMSVDESTFRGRGCREILSLSGEGPVLERHGTRIVQLLFGFR